LRKDIARFSGTTGINIANLSRVTEDLSIAAGSRVSRDEEDYMRPVSPNAVKPTPGPFIITSSLPNYNNLLQ